MNLDTLYRLLLVIVALVGVLPAVTYIAPGSLMVIGRAFPLLTIVSTLVLWELSWWALCAVAATPVAGRLSRLLGIDPLATRDRRLVAGQGGHCQVSHPCPWHMGLDPGEGRHLSQLRIVRVDKPVEPAVEIQELVQKDALYVVGDDAAQDSADTSVYTDEHDPDTAERPDEPEKPKPSAEKSDWRERFAEVQEINKQNRERRSGPYSRRGW